MTAPNPDEFFGPVASSPAAPAESGAARSKRSTNPDDYFGKVPEPSPPPPPGVVDRVVGAVKDAVAAPPSVESREPGKQRGGKRNEVKPYVAGDERVRAPEGVLDRPVEGSDGQSLIDKRGAPISDETASAIKRSVGSMPNDPAPAPFTPEALKSAKDALAGMAPEQRARQLARTDLPRWMRSAMAAAARQIDREDQAFSRTGVASPEASAGVRRQLLAKDGLNPDDAGRVAEYDAQRGGVPQPLAQATAGKDPGITIEEEAAAKAEGTAVQGNSVAVRGTFKAVQGLKQAAYGVMAMALRAAGDEKGAKLYEADGAKAKVASDAAAELMTMRERAGEAGIVNTGLADYLERQGTGAAGSVVQNLPGMAAGALTTLATGNPLLGARVGLSLMSVQVFGQEYINRRTEGQAPAHAAGGAAVMAALEYIGERYGLLPQAMSALRGKASTVALEELPQWAERAVHALEKRKLFSKPVGEIVRGQVGEQIGEQITGAGQYLLDGTKLGLDQPISVSGFLENARDTAVQTFIATGAMQAGGAAGNVVLGGNKGDGYRRAAEAADLAREAALKKWGFAFNGDRAKPPSPPAAAPAPVAASPTAPPDTGAATPLGSPTVRVKPAAPAPDKPEDGAPLNADDLLGTPVDDGAHIAATSPTNDLPEPTDAQKKAGNYKVGRIKLGGLDISIENPQGSVRRGVDEDGKAWENQLQHHYGYIRGTIGKDGDHVDTFIKPGTPEDYAGPVFVVDQRDPKTGKFDEHKVMLGFDSPQEAEAAYRANYAPDWQGLGYLSGMDMPAFQKWIADGNHKQPFAAGFKETKGVDKPDLPVPSPVAAPAPAAGGAVPGRSDGNLGSVPGADGGVGVPAAAPIPGSGAPGPVGNAGTAGSSLSDTPDFKTTWPKPVANPDGKGSMFEGLEDDPEYLAEAVKGVHQETGVAIQSNATTARVLRDAMAKGIDPATGQPPTPERAKEMQGELDTALNGIDSLLNDYAGEFGDAHRQAFQGVLVPDLADLHQAVQAPAAAPPAMTDAQKKRADALKKIGKVMGVPEGNAEAPVQADSGSAAPAPATPAPAQSGTYTLSDSISADGPTSETIKLVVRPDGSAAIQRDNGDVIDVTNMIRAGFSAERAIAQTLGHDTSGKNVSRPTAPVAPAPDAKADRRAAIQQELDKLQKQYEKKSSKPDMRVPPSIRASALDGITKKMDKLEAELKTLNAAPVPAETPPSATTVAQPAADSESPAKKTIKERAAKATKTISRFPKTVHGSKLLAGLNQMGGLSPNLLHDLSFKREFGPLDKFGRRQTSWFNPSAGKGIRGGLFREGGMGDTNEIAEWMELAGYIPPGSLEADYKAADELARSLITQALNQQEPQTIDEIEAEAEAARDAEDTYYRGLAAEDAAAAEELRLFLMGEAALTQAEVEIGDDDFFALDNQVWEGPATQEDLLQSFGWSDQEINDEIFRQQQVDDANAASLEQEGAAGQLRQEDRSNDASRPGAVPAPGEVAPRPADRQDQAQQVDAAVGRLTDAQVDAVAAEFGIRDGADAPMKRTLLLTRDAGQVLDAIKRVLSADEFALVAPTREQLQAEADRAEQARQAEQAEQRRLAAAEAARKRELEKKRADDEAAKIRKERADAAVDDFQLGQEPPSAKVTTSDIVGQKDVFADAPEEPAPATPRFKVGDMIVVRDRMDPNAAPLIVKVKSATVLSNGIVYGFIDPRFSGNSVESSAVESDVEAAPAGAEATAPKADNRPKPGSALAAARSSAESTIRALTDEARQAGTTKLADALATVRISSGALNDRGMPPAYARTLRERMPQLLERAKANPTDDFQDIRLGNAPSTKVLTPEEAAAARNKRLAAIAKIGQVVGPPKASEPEPSYGGAPAPTSSLTREQEAELLPVLAELLDAAVMEGHKTFKAAASQALADLESMLGAHVAAAFSIKHLQGAYISMSARYPDGEVDDTAAVAQFKTKDQLKETTDAADPTGDVERDRAAGEEPGVAPPVLDGQQPDQVGNGRAGRSSGSRGGRPGGGTRVPRTGTTAAGEGSDQGLFDDQPDPAAGSADDERGDPVGDQGSPPESLTDEGVEEAARRASADRLKKGQAQRDAEGIPVALGDIDNIRQTLPALLPKQQDDVLFAEQRFAKDDGYGVLFTNGTGTGKTYSALGIIKRYAKQGKKNILVVVPDQQISIAWQRSAPDLGLTVTPLRDTKDAGGGIVITTYANVRDNDALINRKWDLVVADEAHEMGSGKDGEITGAGERVRALTLFPSSADTRARMRHPELAKLIDDLNAQYMAAMKAKNMAGARMIAARLDAPLREFRGYVSKEQEEIDANQGIKRPRAVFLSATPFAWDKNIQWAQGYLFDWNKGHDDSGKFSAYQAFMIQNFGWRLRYNKLTEPDERKVNRGVMQRAFNTRLKSEGVLSGRRIDSEFDYDRRFVSANSAIGTRIDSAFDWFWNTEPSALADMPVPEGQDYEQTVRAAMYNVRSRLRSQFGYLTRLRMLEAMKAEASIPYVRAHLAMGRKVVVFHDLIQGERLDPFNIAFNEEEQPVESAVLAAWQDEFKDLVEYNWNGLKSPIEAYREAFGPQVRELNGQTVTGKQRQANVDALNDDNEGPMVLLVQADKDKGWSGHDTTGKYPRVLMNLGLPLRPTRSIQQEGRIYRVGQASNAMFRYFNTQTNWEREAFAKQMSRRASTAENLAMGEEARGLMDAYIAAFEDTGEWEPGFEGEGTGGQAGDRAMAAVLTEFDLAKTLYWAQLKKTAKTKAQEGNDYFATPEPLGLKMVQWLDLRPDESFMEPSAGHGAIARWAPTEVQRLAIEPSPRLALALALAFDGKVRNERFEDLNHVNKADGIAMNPPFGVGGKTAIEHLSKAYNEHLDVGGRIVALLPEGPAADARLEKFLTGSSERPTRVLGTVQLGSDTRELRKGDTIFTRLPWAKSGKLVRGNAEDGYLIKVPGQTGETRINADQIIDVFSDGPTKETLPNAAGAHVVATIRLPADTFGRAGTNVRTRIVVIDKLDKDQAGPARVDYDFSQLESVEELFDEIEGLALPERTKPRPAEVDEDAPQPTEQDQLEAGLKANDQRKEKAKAKQDAASAGEKLAEQNGLQVIDHTSQNGKQLRGVILRHVAADAVRAGPAPYAFKKDGGVFVNVKSLADVLEKFPLPPVAQEERAVYAVREPDASYDVDLFGNQVPQPAVRAVPSGRRPAARRDVPAATTLSVRPDPTFPGVYRVTTQLVEVGRRELPVSRVRDWSDAAAALSSMHRYAVEHFDVLITDAAGKPLAVVGAFKGDYTQASVYPRSMLAEALRIEGAHAAWGVHNHPSGESTLSSADYNLSAAIGRVFDPSSVKWMGLAAVANDGVDQRYTATTGGYDTVTGMIVPGATKATVPVVERTLIVDDRSRKVLDSPSMAKNEIAQLLATDGRPGILFLDNRHAPQAWVPLDPADMGALRQAGRFDRLINSAAEGNATAAIIANQGGAFTSRTLDNVASALALADIRVLDVIDGKTGQSLAEAGALPSVGLPVLSQIGGEQSPGGVDVRELRRGVLAATTLWSRAPGMPTVSVVATAADLPQDVQNDLAAMRALNTTRGLMLPDGRVFLVADRINNVAEGQAVLFHETYGHFGLRAFLGPVSYESQMGLLRMANPKLAAEANAWYAAYGESQVRARVNAGMSRDDAGRAVRALAVEEALADRAGLVEPPKGWKLLMARLQKALRAIGWDGVANMLERMTEAETHALLINARRVLQGEAAHVNSLSPNLGGAMDRTGVNARTVGQGRIRRSIDELTSMAASQVRKGTDPSKVVSYDRILEQRADVIEEIRARYGRADGRGDGASTGRAAAAGADADAAGRGRAGRGAAPVLSQAPAAGTTVEINGRTFRAAPPPAAGMVRWYHGGSPESVTGPLWFTAELRDAHGWASRGKGMQVWYVDVPKGAPGLEWGDPANGIIMPSRQELPAALAGQRRPLYTPVTPPAPTLKPSTGIVDTLVRLPVAPLAKVTSGAYTRAIEIADRALSVFGDSYEYAKAGLVDQYGLTPEHTDRKIDMKTAIRVNARKTNEIIDKLRALDRAQSRVAYLWMTTNPDSPTAEQSMKEAAALFDQLPEEPRLVLASLKRDIEFLGDEAVELGLMSQDVRDRNRLAYLHRSYEKYEATDAGAKVARSRAIKLLGEQFKGRGMRHDAGMEQIAETDWWKRKTNGSAHDPSLKGQRFQRLELRATPDTNTPQLFEDENGKPMGKLQKVVYWPEGEPIPRQYADWRNDGVWEARFFDKGGKVGMWRDFTLAERTKMGEIQEVKYATAVTMMQMVRDVETARFLDWVARNEAVLDEKQLPDGAKQAEASTWLTRSFLKNEWVQVPAGKIPGTQVTRYGNLAGRWVPGPVWNDIRQIAELSDQNDLSQVFQKMLKAWKISKALALDTPIPTPSGWTTMGEIKVGDKVFDEQGQVCEVLGATPVQLDRKCYRVEFSDGTSIVADAEHLWFTIRQGTPGVRNTEEILATLKERTRGDANHKIPVADELALDEVKLPLAPYVLGAWLGDGDTRTARITAGVEDVTELRQHLVDAGVRCAPSVVDMRNGVQTFQVQRGGAGCIRGHDASKTGPSGCWQCNNELRRGKQPEIVDQNVQVLMREMGLLGNKHIPAVYLRASAAQRRELLQGLMDTDGNITEKGLCSFSTSLASLRDGMLELLRSLGYKPSVNEWQPTCNGKPGKTAWRIHFKAYADKPVFKLARKNCRLAPLPANKQRSQSRQIVAITPVASVPVRCIAVSSKSRLYLAGPGMVPTHNTALSPVTHTNNVMANFMLADMHDIQARHLYTAMKTWAMHKTDPIARKLLEDYQDNGGDAGMFNESEIREELFRPLLEELRKEIEHETGQSLITAAQVLDLLQHRQFRQAFAAIGQTKAAAAAAWVPKKMMKLYGVEDEVFRLAAFIKARQDGLGDREAGKFASDSFLNYDITAPWINAMRRSAFPFIAFTYRAAPMLARTMADKPHKLVKYMLITAALNALAYAAIGGGDPDKEEKERALLADEKAGRIWGFLGPKLMRMPWNDRNGNPVFLDIRRWIPAGDIVDLGQSHSMIPLPSPIVPGGPLALFGEFVFNSSGFTGNDIVNPDVDSAMERAGKAADWLWKGVAPNFPGLPGTYATDSLVDAFRGRVNPGPFGQEKASGAQAAFSAVGVKVGSYPIESLDYMARRKTDAITRKIVDDVTKSALDIRRSGLDPAEQEKLIDEKKAAALGKLQEVTGQLRAKREKAGLQ